MSGAKHFTYVIASPTHVKIGHSRDPKGRLGTLQIGSGVALWVAKTWPAERADAVALEGAMHRAFAWRASEGEWFWLAPSPVIAVGDLLATGRVEDAGRLLTIIRRREAIVEEAAALRRAWRWAPGRERRRVELEAAAKRKALEAEDAALQLAAYDLGLWPEGSSETALPSRLEYLRLLVA